MNRLIKDCRVLILNGTKAYHYQNIGDATSPKLKLLYSLETTNPPSHEQGDDRAGRVYSSHDARRSSMETTDFHQKAETDFVNAIAKRIDTEIVQEGIKALIIAAPPIALANWRKFQSSAIEKVTIAAFNKDYTNTPLLELAQLLTKELEGA